MKKFLFSAFILLIVSAVSSQSQNLNSVGLSASLQNDQYGIAVPIRLSEKIVLMPALSLMNVEDVQSDYFIGITSRFYREHPQISPYIGLNIGLLHNTSYVESSRTGEKFRFRTDYYVVGGSFGAEYYLGTAFSIGIEAQANAQICARTDGWYKEEGKVDFNLATILFATIYFK